MKSWKIVLVLILVAASSALSVLLTLRLSDKKVEVVYVNREVERTGTGDGDNGVSLRPVRDERRTKHGAKPGNAVPNDGNQVESVQPQDNSIDSQVVSDFVVSGNREKWESSINAYLSGGEKSSDFRNGSDSKQTTDNVNAKMPSSTGEASGGGYAVGGGILPNVSDASAGAQTEFDSSEKVAVADSFATLSVSEQREEIQHTLNLLNHEDMAIIDSIMLDTKMDSEVLDIIFNNVLNRPRDVKAEALRKIANVAGHPYADKAKDFLQWND